MTAHTDRAHAKLSPSAAHRWFQCPGSIRLSAGIVGKRSHFADEGTAAHTLAEQCLRNGLDATDFLGGCIDINDGTIGRDAKSGKGVFEVTEEMAEGVQLYLDTVRDLTLPGDEIDIEAKLDLRHIPGMDFGTGDWCRYRPSLKELVICDLKYGKGVPVEVEDNEQLLTYAEGVAKRYHNRGLTRILLVVVQPRCPHPKGPVRVWSIDTLELVEFKFRLIEAAQRAMQAAHNYDLMKPDDAWLVNGDWALNPGDWCKFCPAAATCPALRDFSLKTAEMEFSDAPPVVTGMSPDEKSIVLAKAEVIEGWCKRVKESAHADALEGNGPTGWKLVESTSHRKFKDDVDPCTLGTLLGVGSAIMTEPKMKSPAQVEALIGKKRKGEIADYVFKPRGKVILVPDSDPRPTVKPDAEQEFA